MEITDVRVRKVALDGKMRAIVSITLDNEFVVHDIKVIEGEKGVFVAMPSRKSATGEYRDIAHPINSETRDYVQKIILEIRGGFAGSINFDFITIRQRYMNTYKRKTALGQSFFLLQLSSSFGIMWLRENVT